MLMTIKVTFPGQTDAAPVAVLARDALVWEKTVRPAQSFSSFLNDVTMTGVYYLAFIACRRQGLWTKDRASFEQECDAVPVPDDEEGTDVELDPTRRAASPESASSLPATPASPRKRGRPRVTEQS